MATRPIVLAFDVIETLFPLEPLRQRIIEAGQPGHILELWFTRLLRDAFALVATDCYRPFPEIAASALSSATGHALTDDAVRGIVAGFAELDPHPDVGAAMRRAHEAGLRVVTLTNGSARVTDKLLQRGAVRGYVEQILSVDDVRRWKPAPEIYRHAAQACDVPPDRVALVAAHSWDTHGPPRRTGHWVGQPTGAPLPRPIPPSRRHRTRPGLGRGRTPRPAKRLTHPPRQTSPPASPEPQETTT